MEGWQTDISGARSLDELPAQARTYLKKLEEVTGCPVVLVSIGARRDQTIQLRNPFA
jgi:adenylosuccinate synthase